MARSKKSGLKPIHVGGIVALLLFVVFAVARDAAVAETEGVLKRRGWWPQQPY
jgi:hypothetical protein